MRFSVSLLLFVAATAPAQDAPPASDGPQATPGRSSETHGIVGYATVAPDLPGIAVQANGLAVGSFAEVTSLRTGRTLLLAVAAGDPGVLQLSLGAARLFGVAPSTDESVPVRIRSASPEPGDAAALAAGRPVLRLDASPQLLAGLRRRLPSVEIAPDDEVTASPDRVGPPVHDSRASVGAFVVQVRAIRTAVHARAAAAALHGVVAPDGTLWRVRVGPFATRAQAQRARDAAVRHGYAGATILRLANDE